MRNIASFVTTVRCDIRDIAVIGKYMTAHGSVLESRGIIASQGIKILANVLRGDQPKNSILNALEDLTNIGCGAGKHDRAEKGLAKQLLESQREDETSRQIKEFNLKQTEKQYKIDNIDKIGKDYFNVPEGDR